MPSPARAVMTPAIPRWRDPMPEKSSGQEGAAAAASTQPIELSKSDPAIDNQNPTKSALKKQAIADLRRDFIAEALRIVVLKAGHAGDDVLIGDDIAAERSIRLAISHLKEAAKTFREMLREVPK
jgi:hypothetical protein